jgi:hypothetical protein
VRNLLVHVKVFEKKMFAVQMSPLCFIVNNSYQLSVRILRPTVAWKGQISARFSCEQMGRRGEEEERN